MTSNATYRYIPIFRRQNKTQTPQKDYLLWQIVFQKYAKKRKINSKAISPLGRGLGWDGLVD
jgi:hypothetical protein